MKFRSDICEVMYEDALANFKIGAISEDRLKEYQELCFEEETEPAYEPEEAAVLEGSKMSVHAHF